MSVAAHAQEDASVTVERKRLAAEREKVESTFKAKEKACYAKFAVNDCLAEARATRREAMDDLRRQEIALNDVQRKRAAAERRQEIEQKNNAQREREEGGAKPASQPDRTLRSNERAASRAQQANTDAQKAAERQKEVDRRVAEIDASKRRRDEEAAKNAREHERKVLQARERQEQLRKRAAERTKAPASSLADPK